MIRRERAYRTHIRLALAGEAWAMTGIYLDEMEVGLSVLCSGVECFSVLSVLL